MKTYASLRVRGVGVQAPLQLLWVDQWERRIRMGGPMGVEDWDMGEQKGVVEGRSGDEGGGGISKERREGGRGWSGESGVGKGGGVILF